MKKIAELRKQLEMKKKFDAVKAHVQTNRRVYITGATCFAVGVVATALRQSKTEQTATLRVLAWKTGDVKQNVIQTQLPRRGHPGNIILCNETGIPFSSQNQAATMMGLDPGNLSKHMTGRSPHVGGYTFTNLGEAAPQEKQALR